MLELSKFEEKDNYKDFVPSKADSTKVTFVKKRFDAMQQARQIVDKDWEEYQQMIDAIFVPYPDERSSSVIPLASSLIELYVAETLKLKTEFNFR